MKYKILVASTKEGLVVAAKEQWLILPDTIMEFSELSTNTDFSLGRIGGVRVTRPGFVALGYQEEP